MRLKFNNIGLLALISIILNSCVTTPPKKINNICTIFEEKRSWHHTLNKVEQEWGVEPHILMAIIYQESSFKSTAQPPKKKGIFNFGHVSTAYGYAQALDGTWDEYKKDTGNFFAIRSDFGYATDFMGWYIDKTESRTGASKNDAYKQYLAYHEGAGGFNRGTYKRKKWLMKVARKVARLAETYRKQIPGCKY